MKILLKILFAVSALISYLIFALFVLSLVAWLSSGGNVILPGLGLVVAMGFFALILFVFAAMSVFITFLLGRIVFKGAMK